MVQSRVEACCFVVGSVAKYIGDFVFFRPCLFFWVIVSFAWVFVCDSSSSLAGFAGLAMGDVGWYQVGYVAYFIDTYLFLLACTCIY